MAMDQSMVYLLFGLAVLASAPVFLGFDVVTRVVMAFFGSLAWASFGLGASHYEIKKGVCCTYTVSNTPLMLLGFGAAVMLFVFFLDRGYALVQSDSGVGVGG